MDTTPPDMPPDTAPDARRVRIGIDLGGTKIQCGFVRTGTEAIDHVSN